MPAKSLVLMFGILLPFLMVLAACKHPSTAEPQSQLGYGDFLAPQLTKHQVCSDGRVLMTFDEPVQLLKDSLILDGGLSVANDQQLSDAYLSDFEILMAAPSTPGQQYNMGLTVRDQSGNMLRIVLPFFGPNTNPAQLIINEVLTKVSSKNSDAVEFLVKRAGNLAGLCFFLGSPEDYEHRFIFPNMLVKKDELIVLHLKPEGLTQEVNETSSKSASGGKNAQPDAWDFWLKEGAGLPDSHAIISLAETPLGPLMDCLYYGDKESQEGKDYLSFGSSRMLSRAQFLEQEAVWALADASIRVEDAASSVGLTGTRSLNRKTGISPNGKQAWYVCESSGASIGLPNSLAVYVP